MKIPLNNEVSVIRTRRHGRVRTTKNHHPHSGALRLTRLIFVLLCIGGFFFQVWTLLEYYFQYPTRTEVENRWEKRMNGPAITLCNYNDIRKSALCQRRKDLCVKYKGLHLWDAVKPFMMSSNYQEITQSGHSFDKLVSYCQPQRACLNDVQSFLTYHFGNCYTVGGNTTGNLRDGVIAQEYNKIFDIHLNLEPKEYLTPLKKTEARVSVHNPYDMPRMYFESINIEQGTKYVFQVIKNTVTLLPAPYHTNCRAYKEEYTKSGYKGPLSRTVCFNRCHRNISLVSFGCVKIINSTYPITKEDFNNKCPENGVHKFRSEDSVACASLCGHECRFSSFDVQLMKTELSYLKELTIWNETRSEAMSDGRIQSHVEVSFQSFNHKISTIESEFQALEMWGYVGGYLGLYLGVSLISVPRYFLVITVYLRKLIKVNSDRQ